MVVNTEDTIVVTSDSRYDDTSIGTNDQIIKFVSLPDHLYVSFKTNNIYQKGSIIITPNPATKGKWEVNLRTSNQSSPLNNILTISILKNGNPTMSNVVINNSIVAGQFYQVDLAD